MIRLTILKYNSDEQPCSSTICTATDAANQQAYDHSKRGSRSIDRSYTCVITIRLYTGGDKLAS